MPLARQGAHGAPGASRVRALRWSFCLAASAALVCAAVAVGISRSKRPVTAIPGGGRHADPVEAVRPVPGEEPNEPPPPPRPRLPEPARVETEVTPEEPEVTPGEAEVTLEETDESFGKEIAAMERELQLRLSFDPELVLDVGMDELRELRKQIEADLDSRIEPSLGYDPATARELVRGIRENVVPGPEQKDFLENILPTLEHWAQTLPEGKKATWGFRQVFLSTFLGANGVYYRPDQVPIEIDFWGKVLGALGCELSEEEEVRVGKAIRRVSKLREALSRVFSRVRHPRERLGELGPNTIGTLRSFVLDDLEDREAEGLWSEFQKALTENLSPSNLERAARLFRAFGVWTEN